VPVELTERCNVVGQPFLSRSGGGIVAVSSHNLRFRAYAFWLVCPVFHMITSHVKAPLHKKTSSFLHSNKIIMLQDFNAFLNPMLLFCQDSFVRCKIGIGLNRPVACASQG